MSWTSQSRHVAPCRSAFRSIALISATKRPRSSTWGIATLTSTTSCNKGEMSKKAASCLCWRLFCLLRQICFFTVLQSFKTLSVNFLLHRITLLQEAVNKNQEFNSAIQSLTAFLINMPNNEVRPGESVSQIYAKQNSQLVSIKF